MDPNTNPSTNQNPTPSAAPVAPNPLFQNTIPTTVKSSVAAGLLGIFLGSFGAHNWYLGEKKKGILHVALLGGGFLLTILAAIMTALTARVAFLGLFFGLLSFLGYVAVLGNNIWGFVEGVILLVQGDAGLAAKGYHVATVAAVAQPAAPAAPATPTAPAATESTPATEVKEVKEVEEPKESADTKSDHADHASHSEHSEHTDHTSHADHANSSGHTESKDEHKEA